MKRILAFVFALFLFAVPVSAQQEDVAFTYTEGITVCTKDNIPSKDGMIFGVSEAKVKEYLTENEILAYGMDNGNAFAFELTGEKTDFTDSIIDLSLISNADVKDFAEGMISSNYSIKNVSDNTYIVTDIVYNLEEEHIKRQYITVKNRNLYVVTFTLPGSVIKESTSEQIDKIINGLSFGKESAPQNISLFYIIGVAALVFILASFAIYILITVIKDIRKRKNDSEKV